MLYSLLFLMMLVASGFLAYPFIKHGKIISLSFALMLFTTIAFTVEIYVLTGNNTELSNWVKHGKTHYELLEKFQQLGGLEGAIQRIEEKLEKNPSDFQGWVILGKLYFSKQDYAHAAAALSRAHQLYPQDAAIEHFYELARDTNKQKQKI